MTSDNEGAERLRLVAYLRVSTLGQVTDGFGLDVQERDIADWAARIGHEVVATAQDPALSGTLPPAERPGLSQALDLIRRSEVDGLVVHRLDRLARTLTIQEAALEDVWVSGGRVFTVDVGELLRDDPDDPVRTFVRQVMGAAVQLDRAMIAKRLRSGRAVKASKGGYVGGAPGFGWRSEDRCLVEDETEQAVLDQIRGLRAQGLSLRDIGRALTADGHRPKRGQTWHPETLRRLLLRAEVG